MSDATKDSDRYFLQVVMTKKGTVMEQWTVNDREIFGNSVVRIYRRGDLAKKIVDLLNKEDGYLA